jgi:formate-nitrite transporter family protein
MPGLFSGEVRHAFSQLGAAATAGSFWAVLVQGIVAGWIIALMVWILPASGSARFLVIVAATYMISIAKLAHVVAGWAEVGYAAIVGTVSWTEYVVGFVLPVLLGNSIGGIVFVAILNHAQVMDEK